MLRLWLHPLFQVILCLCVRVRVRVRDVDVDVSEAVLHARADVQDTALRVDGALDLKTESRHTRPCNPTTGIATASAFFTG